MDVSVALDSNRRRNLEFFDQDDTEIVLTVYEHDGDDEPIAISDAIINYGNSGMAVGGTFSASFENRERYTITGYIAGKRTTLAYGLLIRKWYSDGCGRSDSLYEPLFVRNEIDGGVPGSYFEGPGDDGGAP
jgi:hypothetical protein